MAGLRVSAIPYRLVIPGDENQTDLWYFFVVVADPDGTPRTGLKLSNFTVRVHTKGVSGPYDDQAGDYIDQVNPEPVALFSAWEAKFTSEIYTLQAQAADPKVTKNVPYVFSISVTIPPLFPFPGVSGTTGRALASHVPCRLVRPKT